jgi:hypothetical protein
LFTFITSGEVIAFTSSGEGTIPVTRAHDPLATSEEYRIAVPHVESSQLLFVESIYQVATFKRWFV